MKRCVEWSVAAGLLTLLNAGHAAAHESGNQHRGRQEPVSKQESMMRAGQAVYVDNCSACHTRSGAGRAGLFPALKANPEVDTNDPTSVIRLVLEGSKSGATDRVPTGAAMPAFGWKLTDKEVAAVITYVRNSWGNEAPDVSSDKVRTVRTKDCTGLEARLHLESFFDYFCKK